jgi:hypothetical protein
MCTCQTGCSLYESAKFVRVRQLYGSGRFVSCLCEGMSIRATVRVTWGREEHDHIAAHTRLNCGAQAPKFCMP